MPEILYTQVDESPALATASLLPILTRFLEPFGISIVTKDISLAGRILAAFSDQLPPHQQYPDDLAELGQKTLRPETNIIKLPNISASIPQLKAAIAELQSQGFDLPSYPENPQTDAEKGVQARYKKVLGSAVNPVLREGNSDRRAPRSVKNFAKANPHKMGKWEATSRTQVSTMTSGDFYANEQSKTWKTDDTLQIEHIDLSGKKTLLKSNLSVKSRDILDATCLDVQKLRDFFNAQFEYARSQNLLISLHLKATMMKVSDPVIFGHAVSVYLDAFIQQHHALLDTLGWNPNNGIQDLENKLKTLPSSQSETLISELQTHVNRFPLAMVNSEKGITNLHVPSDVIVDASMPAMIRDSGKMWNAKGERQETNALIPDRSYAGIYQVVINDCKKNGAFDPSTMGSVPNVGLMAQKAEEYGSHDKTFIAPSEGKIQVRDTQNQIVFEHSVHAGDIWRMCQTKDAPIRDWVKLAVNRATLSQTPAIFWLDPNRAHDQEVAQKVTAYLEELNTQDADIRILSPLQATEVTLDRIRKGLDTISVSGNVLRDYLTDLFPILELGTSAKMLSIVPLMNGGGLFETGAGGSAPKLAQQFIEEGHLRWDSLGEFLALSASLEHMANTTHHNHASVFSETLDTAIECSLSTHKTPGHDSGTLDNRGTHFYLALFWAKALSEQTRDLDLQAQFKPLYEVLSQNEALILDELTQCQGKPQDIKGYYRPNPKALNEAMRPSTTFNHILENN